MNKKSTLQFWKASKPRRIMNMGIGLLGGRKLKCPECDEEFHDSHIVFKRKFRWTIEGETTSGKFEPLFVKVQSRPEQIEETEINFINGKMWIPGKQDWQRITLTAFDLSNSTDLWKAIESNMHAEGECPPEKYGTYKLNLYDGCGCLIESWELSEAYISRVNFGELDYSSSDETTVEFDIRYKKVTYKNNCGPEGKLQYLPGSLGMCGDYNRKVTCPKCKHEFQTASNVIY